MTWTVEIKGKALKNLKKLDIQTQKRILRFLNDRISGTDDPRQNGKALAGSELGEFWRYRIGDYRIIAHLEDDVLKVVVVKIGNRKDVYR